MTKLKKFLLTFVLLLVLVPSAIFLTSCGKAPVDQNTDTEPTTYAVTFVDYDGTTVLKTEDVESGSDATAPADPTREGYIFTGWDPADFTNITEDTTITAQYTENIVSIVGDWKTWAVVIGEETIPAGEGSDFAEDFLVLSFDDEKVDFSMNQSPKMEAEYIYDEENDIYIFETESPEGSLKFEISVLELEDEDERLEVKLYIYNSGTGEWDNNPMFDIIMVKGQIEAD